MNNKNSACNCPGTSPKAIEKDMPSAENTSEKAESMLRQWPVQIQLVSPNAPYFENADLLIAADCAAYAYGNFHNDFIKNKIVLIGCPKLDSLDYTEKLEKIISENNIKSVTVVKMEVPCCTGLERATLEALRNSGKKLDWESLTVSLDGNIL